MASELEELSLDVAALRMIVTALVMNAAKIEGSKSEKQARINWVNDAAQAVAGALQIEGASPGHAEDVKSRIAARASAIMGSIKVD